MNQRDDSSSHTRQRMVGVTLIELMIVLLIISILTSIAYPSYRNQVLKSGRAEAKQSLMESAQALEKCFTRFGTYNATDIQCPALAPLRGAGEPSDHGKYLVTFSAAPDATSYTLQAVPQGAQAEDTRCGTLTIDQANQKTRSGTDTLANCW